MIYSDNQTKHFYALKSTDTVEVNESVDGKKIRLIFKDNNGNAFATSDMIDRKLILKMDVKEVLPVRFRTWTVNAPSTVEAGKTYRIYFYLENLLGFGIQDRWDLVAAYTAKANDTATTVMTALSKELDGKLNAAGPIKGDFNVTLSGSTITVAENTASKTYKFSKNDIYLHGTPYMYDVTMSTFDGNEAWGNQKVIYAQDVAGANGIRIPAAMRVLDMEHYFLRNRADLYDLTPDFYTSIINETNTDESASAYYTLDLHYAFSDELGFTYFSEKDLTVACPVIGTLNTLKSNIETPSTLGSTPTEGD